MQDRPAKAAAPSPGSNVALAAACGLTALAGCVDVLAVLHGAAILPVYVTGDTTKLAAALVEGAWSRCWPPVTVVLAFLASSILTAWLGRIATPRPRPAWATLLVGGFLLLGGFLGLRAAEGRWDLAVLFAVAAAMGRSTKSWRATRASPSSPAPWCGRRGRCPAAGGAVSQGSPALGCLPGGCRDGRPAACGEQPGCPGRAGRHRPAGRTPDGAAAGLRARGGWVTADWRARRGSNSQPPDSKSGALSG